MANVPMIVTVEEGHLPEVDAVSRSLERKGFRVRDTIPRARSITGFGEEAALADYAQTEGVKSVRRDRGVQLPPMSEDVPQ